MVRYPSDQTGGFTLLEALVGLTLFSLVILAVYSGMRVGIRTWEAGTVAQERAEVRRVAIGFFERYLSRAFALATSQAQQGRQWKLHFQGSGEEVVFIAEVPNYLGDAGAPGGLHEFTVKTRREEGAEVLALERRALDLDEVRVTYRGEAERKVLVEELVSFRLDYYGKESRGEAEWRDEWGGTLVLPQLVRIQIETKDGEWPTVMVPLRHEVVNFHRGATGARRGAREVPEGEEGEDDSAGFSEDEFDNDDGDEILN